MDNNLSNEEKPKPDSSRQAEIAFRLYDKDKDGYITKSEMEKLSKNLSKEQIDKVFARFDSDGDGKLSYAEFRKMMQRDWDFPNFRVRGVINGTKKPESFHFLLAKPEISI